MQLTEQQQDFVEKFIGSGPRSSTSKAAPIVLSSDPMVIWRSGKKSADGGIGALQNAMRDKDIPALELIAKFGLNGLSERNQTKLMKALFEFNMSDDAGKKKAAKNLSDVAADYQNFIENDPVIALCENNPFGVTVNLKGPLISALSEIETLANAVTSSEGTTAT
ncbi:MAG: hypothetical protein AB3N11_10905 [Arenibacterium sp.]